MSIFRHGPCDAYIKYITQSVVLSDQNGNQLPPYISQLIGPGSLPLYIPPYQRGIVWDEDDIQRFINSPSVLLGNVIVGYFQPNNYNELVDGLQRFAIGTILLHNIYNLVVVPNPPYPDVFNVLQNRNFIGQLGNNFTIVNYNNQMLSNHLRSAVKSGYNTQYAVIKAYVIDQLGTDFSKFINQICDLFLLKQISIDQYVGFSSSIELSSTFIGLNTVRVDLSAIDLVRSHIIQQGANNGWPIQIQDTIENDFTTVFVDNNGKVEKGIEPFIRAIHNCLKNTKSTGTLNPVRIFPGWEKLAVDEVQRLIDYVDYYKSAIMQNPYTLEIAKCGPMFNSLLIAFCYSDYITNDSLTIQNHLKNVLTDNNLWNLLRAVYRMFLDGNVGRCNFLFESIFNRKISNLIDLSNHINSFTSAGSLSTQVSSQWIINVLDTADKNKAMKIFNACLLPSQPKASDFKPLHFGRKTDTFNIDHIVPETIIDKSTGLGKDGGNTIKNMCPIYSQNNRNLSNVPPSQKINIYKGIANSSPHPYITFIANQLGTNSPATIDNINELVYNPEQNTLGHQRITELIKELENL
jgi:hypothetical protein